MARAGGHHPPTLPRVMEEKRNLYYPAEKCSATYVGIDQRILRTHPNFIRRVISHFVRAHHGKIRRYWRSCKAPRKTPQIVLPFQCSLIRWLKHARACLFPCAGGRVGLICPLNFTMLLVVSWCGLNPSLLPFLPLSHIPHPPSVTAVVPLSLPSVASPAVVLCPRLV